MLIKTKTSVQINGEIYTELESIDLNQPIHSHHTFKVTIRSVKINEASNEFLEKARDFAGSEIAIEIDNIYEDKLSFRGIILKVSAQGTAGTELGHLIVLEGYSPSILLENGINSRAYVDNTLKSIADDVCTAAAQNQLKPNINPIHSETIPYTVQYNESLFTFLNRLACRYGEWFYYDGEALIFGSKEQEIRDLYYGTDLTSFDLELSINAINKELNSKSYREDSSETDSLSEYSTTMRGHTAFAIDKSQELFQNTSILNTNQFNDDIGLKKQINNVTELAFKAEAARRISFSGSSNNPAIKPGELIKINYNSLRGDSQHGEYLVTSIQHNWQSGGQYQNHFSAIPSDAEVSPATNPMAVPSCSTETAIVVDTNDPEGLGRVKVVFNWMKKGESPWIRIASPYAGNNKGIHFIPEIDEEVMVGFEGNNAEKPFVIGTLYNGGAKPDDWTTKSNDIKAIRTRSGHTIELDDTDGEEKIKIYDNEGSIITFDTAEKSLSIVSTETLDISAKKININAKEEILIGCEKNIKIDAEGDLIPLAKGDIKIQSTGDTTIKSSGEITMEATSDASFKGMNVTVEGLKDAKLKGMKTDVSGALTKVTGTAFFMDLK